MDYNKTTGHIVDAAIAVHRELGPGLLESAYQACLLYELHAREVNARGQVVMPVHYGTITIDVGYRIDILADDAVVVELKAVQEVTQLHRAQLLSYLKLGRFPVGLLINFHVERLVDGLQRLINKYRADDADESMR
ncbi:MAG: GxxExxY protein [Pirellulaceae bacterium]|nr:GxxExxY protein [Planctomycetales bacterium]